MGGKSQQDNEAGEALADIALKQYQETQPLRSPLISRGTRFLRGNLDVAQSPMWGAARTGIDQSYSNAREDLFSTIPRGGALYGQLGDLSTDKARSMATARGQIAEGELNRALQLGTWGAAQGTSGLSAASAAQAQQIAAQNAAKGAKGQGLGQLGGAALSAYGMYAMGAMSDRRLKRDLRRVGTLANGVPVYRFRYVWGGLERVGVMAQDVPWAAVMTPSGYLAVDYSRI